MLDKKRPLHAGSRIALSTVAQSLSKDETVPAGLPSRPGAHASAPRANQNDATLKILLITIAGLLVLILAFIFLSG